MSVIVYGVCYVDMCVFVCRQEWGVAVACVRVLRLFTCNSLCLNGIIQATDISFFSSGLVGAAGGLSFASSNTTATTLRHFRLTCICQEMLKSIHVVLK